ncbi:MAG: M18 family aminopeptidase, partial [Porticoccaceae bacterium]|nr:M18 family aminopeptidase [Porticoccaceae bacterium]
CNDHEEVGSLSVAGAQGTLLPSVLQRLAAGGDRYAALAERSMMISADNAHGIHPNYPALHDTNHGPTLNKGPVLKVNANQRYATNSITASLFRQWAERAEVPVQHFVTRSDLGCGSTIGPITSAGVGVPTLDVGVPTFAMHSIRELAGRDDAHGLYLIMEEFFQSEALVI